MTIKKKKVLASMTQREILYISMDLGPLIQI